MSDEWSVIHVYSRAQAITDGVLEDISEQARRYGFQEQTCLAAGVQAILNADSSRGEDRAGRLHDLLFVLSAIARDKPKPRSPITTVLTFDGRRQAIWLAYERTEGWTILTPDDW